LGGSRKKRRKTYFPEDKEGIGLTHGGGLAKKSGQVSAMDGAGIVEPRGRVNQGHKRINLAQEERERSALQILGRILHTEKATEKDRTGKGGERVKQS